MGSSLCCMGSLVVVCGLSCPAAYRIVVPQFGTEPVPLAPKGRFLTTGLPEKSLSLIFHTRNPFDLDVLNLIPIKSNVEGNELFIYVFL